MDVLIAALPDIFAASVRMCVPLLLVALGELFYSERAGLVNIGLDGLMTIGAFLALSLHIRAAIFGLAFWWEHVQECL